MEALAQLGAADALLTLCFDLDLKTGLVQRSGALKAITGYDLHEVPPTAEWWRSLVDPDDLHRLEAVAQALEAPTGTLSRHVSEYRVKHRDGHWVYLWEHALLEWKGNEPRRFFGTTLDVSALRGRDQLVRETKVMLDRIVAALPDLLYIFDVAERRNVYSNKEALRILGYSPERIEAFGSNLLDLLHPEDLATSSAREAQLRQLADEDVYVHEIRMMHADGSYRWLKTREVVFKRDAAGAVTQILGIAHDITGDKVLAERLVESEYLAHQRANEIDRERLRIDQILRNMPLGVAVAEAADGAISFVNAQAEQVWKPSIASAAPLARALRGERVVEDLLEFTRPDGTLAVIQCNANPIRDALGNITAAVAALADITDRVEGERERERLRSAWEAAEARARRVLECGVVGVLYFRLNGEITYTNDEFLRIVGYDRNDMASGSLNWRSITPPEWNSVDEQVIADLKAYGVSKLFNKQYLRKDGTRVDVLLGGAMFDPKGDEGVTLCIDITPQRQIEEQLRRQVHFEKELLAIVGHDLRTPINVISMSAALARARSADDKMSAILQRISSNAERMGRIVGDLLDVSDARLGGGIPLRRAACELSEVVTDAVQNVKAQYPEHRFVSNIPEECQGEWDADRLNQVIQNLLNNAVRHGDTSRPIEIHCFTESNEACVRVHNYGAPIPAELLPAIFQPFRTSKRRDARAADGGLGLGLFIVNSIVLAHGGAVLVTSSAGDGTAFTVRLPVRAPLTGFHE